MKKNKVLSGILAGALALSMSPVAAFAADAKVESSTPVNLTATSRTVVQQWGENGRIVVTLPNAVPLVADDTGLVKSGDLQITNASWKASRNNENEAWGSFEGARVKVDAVNFTKKVSTLEFKETVAPLVDKDMIQLDFHAPDASYNTSFTKGSAGGDTISNWMIDAPTSVTEGAKDVDIQKCSPVIGTTKSSNFTVDGAVGALSSEYAETTIATIDWSFSSPDILEA